MESAVCVRDAMKGREAPYARERALADEIRALLDDRLIATDPRERYGLRLARALTQSLLDQLEALSLEPRPSP